MSDDEYNVQEGVYTEIIKSVYRIFASSLSRLILRQRASPTGK